jgi:hypothetical protein
MGLDTLGQIKTYMRATGCGGEWDRVIDKCIYDYQHGWFDRVTHALDLREWIEGASRGSALPGESASEVNAPPLAQPPAE